MYPNIFNDKKNKIYIEINTRQSGKTHRLIENLVQYIIDTNNDVAVITYNTSRGNLLKARIQHYIDSNKININMNKIKLYNHFNNLNTKNVKIYIDEFDFIQGLSNDFYMRPNLYLSSTENPDINNSNMIKIFKLFTHWRRKEIIDKLLNEN